MKRLWAVIAALCVVAAAGWFFWQGRPREVNVAVARIGPAVDVVYATGFVEAQEPVSISARITAPVSRVLVREGDRVRRGQALVLLVDDEQTALIDQAAAQRRAAEQTERRTLALAKDGWVTRAARDQAVANADAARAAERTALARRDQLVVRANSDGIVTRRDVEQGDLATPGRVLLMLGDPQRIRITATVDERDIARIVPGQQALMTNDGLAGRSIHAHVVELTPGGDPSARAFRVRLLPDEAVSLPLGMTLEINVVSRRADQAVLIPAAAIGPDGRVWLVSQGRAHARKVREGIAGTDTVQALDGVRSGDMVIVNPPGDLADDDRVAAVK